MTTHILSDIKKRPYISRFFYLSHKYCVNELYIYNTGSFSKQPRKGYLNETDDYFTIVQANLLAVSNASC